MLVKKLMIFPATALVAVIPLSFTFLKQLSTELKPNPPLEKNSDNLNLNRKRNNWREHWLKNCRPFNASEEDTIYACPSYQTTFATDPFYLFHYRFEYQNNELNSPFSVLVEKVSSLRYEQNQDILVAKLHKGGTLTLRDFPKEFREIKTKSYLIPNQDCIWNSDKLKWPNSPLSCRFFKEGQYTTISLIK